MTVQGQVHFNNNSIYLEYDEHLYVRMLTAFKCSYDE